MKTDYYNSNITERYYDIAKNGNNDFLKSTEFDILSKYINSNFSICEFGCGEGSKVASFKELNKNLDLNGIDISEYGIKKSLEKNNDIKYIVGDITKTNFENNLFDITMSFFVYEHLNNPLLAFNEMYRTTKKGGYIFLWFPNYGSPLFPSPPTLYGKSVINKTVVIVKRLFGIKKVYKNVLPITNIDFEPDFDTTAEINMSKFIKYINRNFNIEISEFSSKWENTDNGNILFKLYFPFKIFNKSFFKYWGPQCFLVIKKK